MNFCDNQRKEITKKLKQNGKNIYLWDVEGRSGRSLLSTIESHSRAIQGLCWCPQNPELFASCSNDTYINVWDTRTPRSGSFFIIFIHKKLKNIKI